MIRLSFKWFCRLFIVFFLFVSISSGQVYKWTDKDGIVHYSEFPPDDIFYEEVEDTRVTPEDPINEEELPKTETPKKPSVYSDGIFWEIRTVDDKSSYLLGTIHSEDDRVLELPELVIKKFKESSVYLMEILPNTEAIAALSSMMLFKEGQDLKSVIGNDLFAKTVEAGAEYGLPANALIRMKPWAVMMVISVPKQKTGLFLDFFLYKDALLQSKKTIGIETPREQVDVFDTMPMNEQIILLNAALRYRPKMHDTVERMIQSYIADDLETLIKISEESTADISRELNVKIMKRLNDDRNVKMTERLLPYLNQGGAFIAVGALHLAGDTGILQLCKKKGYRILSVPVK